MAATGGSGRSTVSGLLAHALAPAGEVAVFDLAPRLTSPWPGRFTAGSGAQGLAALDPHTPHSRDDVRAACFDVAWGEQHAWQLLTDPGEWHAVPLELPEQPSAWHQLAAIGGWQAVVADTPHQVGHDIAVARCANRAGTTREWYELPHSIGVLTATATANGVQTLQLAVRALQADGLPLDRTVVCLVSTDDRKAPPVVRAAAAMFAAHVSAVLDLPYDAALRTHGLQPKSRLNAKTLAAAERLAAAVLTAAHTAWGEPLPDAPRPAPLSLSVAAL
ncbi:hypothetical protein ACWCXB_24020 [Streptomyces sp. NPDC001514]